MAKPTPAVLSFPPLQKIVWLLSTTFPTPGHRTSLRAHISIFTADECRFLLWSQRGVAVIGGTHIPSTESQNLLSRTVRPLIVGCPGSGSIMLFSSTFHHHHFMWCIGSLECGSHSFYPRLTTYKTVRLHQWCRCCLAQRQHPLERGPVNREHGIAGMAKGKTCYFVPGPTSSWQSELPVLAVGSLGAHLPELAT